MTCKEVNKGSYDAKKVFKGLYYEDFSVLLAKTLNLISLRIYKILLDY